MQGVPSRSSSVSFLQEWITEHLLQNSEEEPIKMLLPGPRHSCLDEAAWESASSTSSQGDLVPQGLECQPATADGVGEDDPPVT